MFAVSHRLGSLLCKLEITGLTVSSVGLGDFVSDDATGIKDDGGRVELEGLHDRAAHHAYLQRQRRHGSFRCSLLLFTQATNIKVYV